MEVVMHQYKGKLIIHTGSMFSGKTSSLKKDLNRFKIAGYKVIAYKPTVDTRGGEMITIHGEGGMEAIGVSGIEELSKDVFSKKPEVIGIDEIQFLGGEIEEIKNQLSNILKSGITIVVAGLDMDYNGIAFEVVKELLPISDYLNKHHAVCTMCGTDAWVSHRKVNSGDRVLIGAADEYEPLCRTCYNGVVEEEKREVNRNQIKLELAE